MACAWLHTRLLAAAALPALTAPTCSLHSYPAALAPWRCHAQVLFSAIAAHKLISALALSSRFLKEGATHKQICLYVGPFALVAPVAVLAGSLVVSSAAAAPAAAWTHLVFRCAGSLAERGCWQMGRAGRAASGWAGQLAWQQPRGRGREGLHTRAGV